MRLLALLALAMALVSAGKLRALGMPSVNRVGTSPKSLRDFYDGGFIDHLLF